MCVCVTKTYTHIHTHTTNIYYLVYEGSILSPKSKCLNTWPLHRMVHGWNNGHMVHYKNALKMMENWGSGEGGQVRTKVSLTSVIGILSSLSQKYAI